MILFYFRTPLDRKARCDSRTNHYMTQTVCLFKGTSMGRWTLLVAVLATALLAGVGLVYHSNADLYTELSETYYSQPQFQVAQGQQLPEFQVAGTMQTGAPAPQGIPLSFQLPVPLPGPSPPAPTVITVGPRAKKAPVCKRCERQMRKIKVCINIKISSKYSPRSELVSLFLKIYSDLSVAADGQ